MQNDRVLLRLICLWWDEVTERRLTLLDSVKQIYNVDATSSKIVIREDLVHMAADCHLRSNKKAKQKKKCLVCIANDELKKYESKLFHMTERNKFFEEMSLQGNWMPRPEEIVVRSNYI